MNRACIVIPVYKQIPSKFDEISLKQVVSILGEFDIFFISPFGLNTDYYDNIIAKRKDIFFDDVYFNDVKGYSSLCKKSFFYKNFLGYEYMLIYQTDCFVFKNELLEWCNKGYDYIGSPWISNDWMIGMAKDLKLPSLFKYFNKVGNGGFSLRKVKSFYYFSIINSILANNTNFNEDVFWSNLPRLLFPRFKYPSFKEALSFGFEEKPAESFIVNNNSLPFGCHAWEKHDIGFWREIFKEFNFGI